MAGKSDRASSRALRCVTVIGVAAVLVWFFPLFRLKPLAAVTATTATAVAAAGAFDPKTAAETFWRERLVPAMPQAADLAQVVQAVRADPATARKSFGKPAGVGVDYFFLRGSGKVVARERNVVRISVDGASHEIVALRIGPVFGNTVRDGTGLLDVNSFPGLQEFNALSAELNACVERTVLPLLREKANVGVTVLFVGCAEAPETVGEPGASLFTVVPVQAEVRR